MVSYCKRKFSSGWPDRDPTRPADESIQCHAASDGRCTSWSCPAPSPACKVFKCKVSRGHGHAHHAPLYEARWMRPPCRCTLRSVHHTLLPQLLACYSHIFSPWLVPTQNPKKCYSSYHIEYLRLVYRALNVDEKKLITQFGGKLRDERFELN